MEKLQFIQEELKELEKEEKGIAQIQISTTSMD